jgi:hypothetical protein
LKFRDTFRQKGLTGPIKEAERLENAGPAQIHAAAEAGPLREPDEGYEYGGVFAVKDSSALEDRYFSGTASDSDFSRFQSRLKQGKVKLCAGCGEVMIKSSRRILSAPWGLALIVLGAVLMTAYGMATNFYQPPWYIKFALPAAYYVGSIFVGVGILFFFIREKVWNCHKCKIIEKR